MIGAKVKVIILIVKRKMNSAHETVAFRGCKSREHKRPA